jgi:hypothetical protein
LTVPVCLEGLSPDAYSPHPLHSPDRIWPETNCYADLWIELLSAMGCEPEAMLGFTARLDFEDDQFGFFKPPADDLETLYGLKLQELAIYEPVEQHVLRQTGRRRLCMVEVDAFFLPDTAGITYRTGTGKTTIGINAIDPDSRRIAYFHNGGYSALEGEDYEGIFGAPRTDLALARPYTEFTTVDPEPVEAAELRRRADAILARHWARRPADNPVRRFQAALPAQAEALAGRAPQAFHDYAFHNPRMLGADFELLGAHLDWLSEGRDPRSAHCRAIAECAKGLTLHLARAVARRRFDSLASLLEPAVEAWERLFATAGVREAA